MNLLNLWIWTCYSWIWTRSFEFQLVLLSSQLVISKSQLATRNSQLVTRVLSYHVPIIVITVIHLVAKQMSLVKMFCLHYLCLKSLIVVTRISLIFLLDEFFIFSFLVLLKEMKTLGESKISSCYFCIWRRSRELVGRVSPRFPFVTLVVESFSSDHLRTMIRYWAESHLRFYQTSTMKLS